MQNEPMFQVQVDETEDTEWNDILRAKGVIPERPPSPTAQLEEALEEALKKQHENRLEDKDISDLEELEDEEDEEFLEFYKKKRLAELASLQNKSKFGDVYHINKPEYNKEVTLASQGGEKFNTDETRSTTFLDNNQTKIVSEAADGSTVNGTKDDIAKDAVYVFVHLSLQSKLQSRILAHIFESEAPKFREIKFVEIPANRAIENYPEANSPTLLVYHNGDVLKNLVTLLELGGNQTTTKDFEKLMVQLGAVDEKDNRLEMNQDDEESREARLAKFGNTSSIRTGIKSKFNVGVGSDSDENYDDDDDFFS
ncbi:similar to Saccharomyces cerevisiae YOR281C PLP2 Essential protein that interacts with the CCT (chaperonin containing TCP-1) complex to stimulate actin folding [Maudiozyma saulgeensis]|uniref:Similar to Saccharomyces cerevisiae YOR281C PLP2 Essential protein that interacts with the CCT (Chaperonin containing TCP-1) complex to stimulate actin folding n=1 Tax=Maudiozyma saulgeensis TaxID=1789683 RepID=A0A1X7R5L2_9SACH|nr:similar to Saccharomyces cerevisiae YOR281C PLP2 Essential protein that interacts with the CCT (chaperonin containing TCP-1) complex to stimulate actin folding [Kazachstania saulgeensis]